MGSSAFIKKKIKIRTFLAQQSLWESHAFYLFLAIRSISKRIKILSSAFTGSSCDTYALLNTAVEQFIILFPYTSKKKKKVLLTTGNENSPIVQQVSLRGRGC